MEKFLGHHGDVGLWLVDKLPKNVKEIKTDILQAGESGHFHRFVEGSDFKVYEGLENLLGYKFFVVGDKGATLGHEEHKQIEYAPGTIIKTKIERTMNPYTEEISRVED